MAGCKMISQILQQKFSIARTAVFPEWQKSSPKRRKEITKKLGEMEGREIIREINQEVKNRYGRLEKTI